jgi:hypothetical protein
MRIAIRYTHNAGLVLAAPFVLAGLVLVVLFIGAGLAGAWLLEERR